MTTLNGAQFRSRAYRGVKWTANVPLYDNAGTFGTPAAGEGLDLDDWPILTLAARPEGLQGAAYAIRGTASLTASNPAIVRLTIESTEFEKAVIQTPTGVELRPVRVTVRAAQTDRTQRTLLDGIIMFLAGGFTL